MSRKILVLCTETEDYGLISHAAELVRNREMTVWAMLVMPEVSENCTERAFRSGADKVSVLEIGNGFVDDAGVAGDICDHLQQEKGCDIVLAPANLLFRSVLPCMAVRLSAGLTADCTEVELDADGRLIQVRPAMGNSLMASIMTTGSVQMATVRSGTYPEGDAERPRGEVIRFKAKTSSNVRRLSVKVNEVLKLSQARVIFTGGAGIGSAENFRYFEEKVRKAGFAVGATRRAVELGYASYDEQVGQTGVTVSPEIYVAFGVSGAIQHIVGMRSSKVVVAVNSDPKAPIFDYADYGACGDWREMLDGILQFMSEISEVSVKETT